MTKYLTALIKCWEFMANNIRTPYHASSLQILTVVPKIRKAEDKNGLEIHMYNPEGVSACDAK